MIDPQKEQARFISLREALFLVAQEKGKTAQEAAAMLAMSLRKHHDWKTLALKKFSPVYGMTDAAAELRRSFQLLDRLATENQHSPVMEDDDILF